MDLFSLDAVNRDIRTFISALPARRGLPSLASTNREQYDIPAGKQQHQPCVIRLFIRSFGRHHRVPHSKSDVHSHQVKTQINITHTCGVLVKNTRQSGTEKDYK
jgi:hypothetical protein